LISSPGPASFTETLGPKTSSSAETTPTPRASSPYSTTNAAASATRKANGVFHGCDFPPVFWEAYGPRPTHPASQIRTHLYRGTIAIQCILESTRYPDVDTTTPRHHLTTATQDLRRLLAI
jgi:hypothetical protein